MARRLAPFAHCPGIPETGKVRRERKPSGGTTMWTNRGGWIGFVAALVFSSQLISAARSQGIIIDRRPTIPISHSYEIREVSIDGRVRDQVAEVQVSQTFHNPGSTQLEAEFLFPLPEEGAIQNFVLMVDGRELPGRLVPKDEARRIYEDIVRSKRDPALLEYMGRGLYRTSVFPIPPGADRKVTMRYTQLCKRERDLIEFAYPLSTQKFTSKPIQRLAVNISLQSKEPIKSIYCPSDDVKIDRFGDRDVKVSMEHRDVVPSRDFRLVYTLAGGAFSANIISIRPTESEDGYFLLLASPEVKPADARPMPKTVIFVIDRSGSMAGKKIEQARKALKSVLNNLREDDLFNIVAYDDRVESFKPELERYSSRVREEAERFVDNIREGGSTNIDSALKTSLAMIHDSTRPSYVLFLTDGLPTAGETRELSIAENCRSANARRSRVFCFGVGYDVNARLLDRLSGGNSGTSEYVKPDEDIESHVAAFYSKMTRPALSDIRIELSGVDVNRTYPRDLPDLFEGGQIVWVGRYRQSGRTTIRVTGKVGGESRSLEFPAELAGASSGSSYDFVERLWAVRRLGDLIDQIDLHGQNRELVDELVSLSTRYGILTPYTSFLADERVPLQAAANSDRTRYLLSELGDVSGQSGVEQRRGKQLMMRAEREANSAYSYDELSVAGSGGGGGGGGPPAAPSASRAGQVREKKTRSAASTGNGGRMMAGEAAEAFSAGGISTASPSSRPADGEGKDGAAAAKVRRIGSKTFYWKKERWIESSLTEEEAEKATLITQLSDEYFKLARAQRAGNNQYLSLDEPITVKLDGKVYRIEPAKKDASR
jgi:Ca-activated chloride channel homolog